MQISLPCFADMENPEYFRLPPANKISPPFPGGSTSLKRSLSDYHNNVSRPPLPPKKLGRSPSGEIANRVNKFEQLAKEGSPPKDDINKGRALISIKHQYLKFDLQVIFFLADACFFILFPICNHFHSRSIFTNK